MPLYLVVGPLRPYTPEDIAAIRRAPRDDLGVRHVATFYSQEEDRLWAVHEAPTEGTLREHLERAWYRPEWYGEVQSAESWSGLPSPGRPRSAWPRRAPLPSAS